MIIDFHVHCFADELAPRAVATLSRRGGIPPRTDGTVDGVRKSMKNAGIDCSVVLPIATKPAQTEKINAWSASIQENDIIAFGSIHPDYEKWKDELKRIKDTGLKGIKLHPDYQGFYVDEMRMLRIYEYAFNLGLIVVLHAGIDIGLPEPCHCTPERLRRVVKDLGGGRLVAAHMGGYLCWDEVEEFLVGEDIYFDTSYSLGHISGEQFKRIINHHGYRKILFATDSPWTDQAEELELIRKLELGKDVEEAVLGGNAGKLLGI